MPDFIEDRPSSPGGTNVAPRPVATRILGLHPNGQSTAVPSDDVLFMEGPNDEYDYWNACRTPWRITMDYAHSGSDDAKDAVEKIIEWMVPEFYAPDLEPCSNLNIYQGGIWSEFKLDGTLVPGQTYQYFATAFAAPFTAAAIIDVGVSGQQTWLNKAWSKIKNYHDGPSTDPNADGYFGDTINLMCMLLITGNWWDPVDGLYDYEPYNPDEIYWYGDKVVYNMEVYEAQWWTRGWAPIDVNPWELLDNNLLRNASFDGGYSSGWDHYYFNGAYSEMYVTNNEELMINIYDGGYDTWHVMALQGELTMEQGKTYTITFDAKASKTRDMVSIVSMNEWPYTMYSGYNEYSLTTTYQTFSYSFTMENYTDDWAELQFELGEDDGSVFIDNVSIIEE